MSRRVLNPYSRITLYDGAASGQMLIVGACRRGVSARYSVVRQRDEPVLFEALRAFALPESSHFAECVPMFGDGNPIVGWRFPKEWASRLRAMNMLVFRNQLPRRVRFRCTLGRAVPSLLPTRHASTASEPIVNPGYVRTCGVGVGRSVARMLERQIGGGDEPPIWLKDPGTRIDTPIWPAPALDALSRRLVPGRDAPAVDRRTTRALLAAGVLVDRRYWTDRRTIWHWLGSEGAARLRRQGFLVIKDLLPPVQVAALRRYYRALIRQGFMPFLVKGGARRFVSHREPMAVFYQHQMTTLMRRVLGFAVRPTGTVVSAYAGGSRLRKHVDGPASDWNVSLQIDFSPEPEGSTPWPLRLQAGGKDGAVDVYLGLGDAVIYAGNRVPHSRPPLSARRRSTMLVFHYAHRA